MPGENLADMLNEREMRTTCWLIIFFSLASIVIIMKRFSKDIKLEISQASISVLRGILEQGDKILERRELRKVTALFILMGVVLSNGYKNSNVYNMVSPRKPLPYEHIRELFRDNFTLYSILNSI